MVLWLHFVPLLAGSLASAINTFEHGGQVGMVLEMYRASGGFFNLLETSIESTLGEKDLEKRENGFAIGKKCIRAEATCLKISFLSNRRC